MRAARGDEMLATPLKSRSATVLVVVVFVCLSWTSRTVVDDAYINFRIVENIWAGHGPVYNWGERVEAGTSLAWVLILAAVGALTEPAGLCAADVQAALRCPPLSELLEAVSSPLTMSRFVRNVLASPALTRVRFSAEPSVARAQVCGE